MSASRCRDDRGVVIVFFALALLVLTTFAAIAIDLGNQRQTKRRGQNAVDAAALAGASVFDADESVITSAEATAARTRARTVLGLNSFDNLSATADPDEYTCGNGEGCRILLKPRIFEGKQCMDVTIKALAVGTTFAGAIGVSDLYVDTSSYGCKRLAAAPKLPALSTFGTCADPERNFKTSGNFNSFEGDIHSNWDAIDNGAGNTRTGTATYVQWIFQNNGLWNGATQVAPRLNPFPGVTAVGTYGPASALQATFNSATAASDNYFGFTGDRTFSGDQRSGIYYTTGKITINAPLNITAHNGHTGATFVSSGGNVEVSGSNLTIRHFDADPKRIALFSDYDEAGDNCDKESIQMSGNCIRVDGVVYASKGKFRLSGEYNGHDGAQGTIECPRTPLFDGGFAAWAIEWSGNLGLLRGGPAGPRATSELFLGL